MNRIRQLNPGTARGKAKDLFRVVKRKLGFVPNNFRVLANSPAVLRGFLSLEEALEGATLSQRLREQISLTVSEIHSCAYCLSAHSFMGRYAGLNAEEITDTRLAAGSDEKSDAVLSLARTIVLERGQLEEKTLRAAREANLSDGEIVEIVATVVLTTLTNYINEIADTEIDFPEVLPRTFYEDFPMTVA
jgi:uncharacterized peroxidase-related enzyme